MPSLMEAARLCMGIPQKVPTYSFGLTGMRVIGYTYVDPDGASCWQPGRNVWLNAGVHDVEGNPLRPDYFATRSAESWMEDYWMPFAKRFQSTIQQLSPNMLIFAEGRYYT